MLADGAIVGAVMSGAFAHTLGRAAGMAWVDASIVDDEGTVQVDCAGTLVKAALSSRAPYDPDGSRMRG